MVYSNRVDRQFRQQHPATDRPLACLIKVLAIYCITFLGVTPRTNQTQIFINNSFLGFA